MAIDSRLSWIHTWFIWTQYGREKSFSLLRIKPQFSSQCHWHAVLWMWASCKIVQISNPCSPVSTTDMPYSKCEQVVRQFKCLPPLELMVQSEARSAAHRLWRVGSWSYLHPNRGHSSILMRLQQSDPVFNMGVDVMRPTFNSEPKYRVTMLTKEEWATGTGTPPAVKGIV